MTNDTCQITATHKADIAPGTKGNAGDIDSC